MTLGKSWRLSVLATHKPPFSFIPWSISPSAMATSTWLEDFGCRVRLLHAAGSTDLKCVYSYYVATEYKLSSKTAP